ncbi:MAG: ATP-binding protein [Sorangiineae bacterium]|nr:ATP-binding protein [Polyangiaceae bacterium]MEB2321310.1 ATP-binding protein [Sorangiineae bacterium]
MVAPGRIRRRLTLAIVVTAVIPLLAAVWQADFYVRQTSARFYTPEVGAHLWRSLALYQELARTVKASMRVEAAAIAAREDIRQAAARGDQAALAEALRAPFDDHADLVSLTVEDAEGTRLGFADRGRPLDPKKENALEVTRPLSDAAEGEAAPQLTAVFAADRARFDELDEMSQFVDTYQRIERGRHTYDKRFVYAFAALLGITILGAVGVGVLLSRGVSTRISELADATRLVGAGDLSIRVPESGTDEIADLARAFNRMLSEVGASRARIEYLQRIGAWQEMARRLAHEIKNPLTPIQLAVQEVHRRYSDGDAGYTKLLDTTLEIVEDEVATLRRLVSEFSDFARMPQAELVEQDLVTFLAEQRERMKVLDEEGTERDGDSSAHLPGEGFAVELPSGPALACIDKQLLRRALINLIRNAAQAIGEAGRAGGRIVVRLHRRGDYWVIDIDDDGPGIAEELRDAIFDPYVTTKTDGTGLGLAIVKKIVVEHGGSIRAEASPLGGARIRVELPVAGTAAGTAARDASDWREVPSSGRAARREPSA